MRWFRREPGVPAAVLERARIGTGEAVLAHAQAADGSWLLGTRQALVLLQGDAVRRVPWWEVHAADWDSDESRLRVSTLGEFGQPRERWMFALEEATALLDLVHERVRASILLQRFVALQGRRGITVTGRRTPEGHRWFVEYDEGVDPENPQVAVAAERVLAQARGDVGE